MQNNPNPSAPKDCGNILGTQITFSNRCCGGAYSYALYPLEVVDCNPCANVHAILYPARNRNTSYRRTCPTKTRGCIPAIPANHQRLYSLATKKIQRKNCILIS